MLAVIVLLLAMAACFAGTSRAATADRLFVVSFNGSDVFPSISPDGSQAGAGDVYLYSIDPAGGVLSGARLSEPGYFAAISPSGSRLYLAGGYSQNITVVNTDNLSVVAQWSLSSPIFAIALSPDGSRLFATLPDLKAVAVVNASTGAWYETIPVGGMPFYVAASPDGRRVYVSETLNDSLSAIDMAAGRQAGTISLGVMPAGVVVSPDGTVWTANYWNNSLTVVDGLNMTVRAVIGNVTAPSYLALDPHEQWAFVTSSSGNSLVRINQLNYSCVLALSPGNSRLGPPVVSGDDASIYVPDEGRKTILALNTSTLDAAGAVNLTGPIMAMAVGHFAVPAATPTIPPLASQTPTGTPVPSYLPVYAGASPTPVPLTGSTGGILKARPWFEPITIQPVTTGDVLLILLIFLLVFIVLAGSVYIMMFWKEKE